MVIVIIRMVLEAQKIIARVFLTQMCGKIQKEKLGKHSKVAISSDMILKHVMQTVFML